MCDPSPISSSSLFEHWNGTLYVYLSRSDSHGTLLRKPFSFKTNKLGLLLEIGFFQVSKVSEIKSISNGASKIRHF